MSFTEVLAELAVNLRLDSSAFASGANKAAGSAKKLETGLLGLPRGLSGITGALGGLAGGFASGLLLGGVAELGGKLVELGKGALDHATALQAESQQIGVTTDDLQRYRFAASQVGLEQDKVDLGLKRLSKSIGLADRGLGPGAKAFELLGINVRDSNGHLKTAAELMPEIAGAIAKIPDPAARAALEFQLFGRSGQDMAPLLNKGAQGINNLVAEADRAGVVISPELIKRAHELEAGFTKLKERLEVKVEVGLLKGLTDATAAFDRTSKAMSDADAKLKGVTDFADTFDKRMGIPSRQEFIASVNRQFTSAHDIINADLKAVQDWAAGVDKAFLSVGASVGRMVTAVGTWLDGKLHAILDRVEAPVKAVGDFFHNLWERVVGHSYVPDMVDGIAAEMARLDAVMVAPVDSATASAGDAFERLAGKLEPLLRELFPEDAAKNDLADRINTINAALNAGALNSSQWIASLDRLLGDTTVTLTADVIPALGGISQSIDDIAGSVEESPMLPWLDKVAGALQGVGQLVGQVFGHKAGGIFGAIVNAIGSIAPLFGGGGGINVGGLESSNAAGLGLPSDFFHRALGGPVVPGRTYMVGEDGPEYVTMGSRGYVSPAKGESARAKPYFDLRGAVMTADLLRQMNAIGEVATGRGAVMGAAAAEQRGYRRASQQIP